MMKYRLFLIVFGTLSLVSLSTIALASVEEESKVNLPSSDQVVKEEGRENQQQKTNIVSNSRLEHLVPSLHKHIARYLTQKETLNFAQASSYCLGSLASQSTDIEIALENQNLTEETFLKYFGENGIYKEAQCLNLSGSSFHPSWLRHLPKTLKALKLSSINTEHFSKFEFSDKSEMIIEIVKALGGTVPQLKFLDISNNDLEAPEAESIAQHLTFLRSLDISRNNLGETGAAEIAKLSSLSSLNISGNQLEDAGAAKIAKMTSLHSLNISNNRLGDEGIIHLADAAREGRMALLDSLDLSENGLFENGLVSISKAAKQKGFPNLRHLNLSKNRLSNHALMEFGHASAWHNFPKLSLLNLSCNHLTERLFGTIVYVAEGGAFKNLKELDLSYNEIADDHVVWGFNRLVEYHAFLSLYTLNMSNNLLTQEVIHQIQGIKEQGYFPTLTELLF